MSRCTFLVGAMLLSMTATAQEAEAPSAAPVVAVTATDFTFIAPDELPGGWVTLKMKNDGLQEHFLSLYRLPPGKTFDDFATELLTPFGQLWTAYAAGEVNREDTWAAMFNELPGWFFEDVVHVGGPALTEAGETAEVTLHLEPGQYVMECYVKTPEGLWHTELGMMKPVSVGAPATTASPPEPDLRLVLRNDGIELDGSFRRGVQVVAVTAAETPDGFAKHDANLFRLDGDSTVDDIVAWSDWMAFDQFRAPAPGHSLGGMEAQVAGRTGYVKLDLAPGRYAWVSEEYGKDGVVLEFTID